MSSSHRLLVSLQEKRYNYAQLKQITLPGKFKRIECYSIPSFFQGRERKERKGMGRDRTGLSADRKLSC